MADANQNQVQQDPDPVLDLATGYSLLKTRYVSALMNDDYKSAHDSESKMRELESVAPQIFDQADQHYLTGTTPIERAAAARWSRAAFRDELDKMGLSQKLNYRNNPADERYHVARGFDPNDAALLARRAKGDRTLTDDELAKTDILGNNSVEHTINSYAVALGGKSDWRSMVPYVGALLTNGYGPMIHQAQSVVSQLGLGDNPQAVRSLTETLGQFGPSGAAEASKLLMSGISSLPPAADEAAKEDRARRFDQMRAKVASLAPYQVAPGGQGFLGTVTEFMKQMPARSPEEFSIAIDAASSMAQAARPFATVANLTGPMTASNPMSAQVMGAFLPNKSGVVKGNQVLYAPQIPLSQTLPTNAAKYYAFMKAQAGMFDSDLAAKAKAVGDWAEANAALASMTRWQQRTVAANSGVPAAQLTSPMAMTMADYNGVLAAKQAVNPWINYTLRDYLRDKGIPQDHPMAKALDIQARVEAAQQDLMDAKQAAASAGADVAHGSGLFSGLQRYVADTVEAGKESEDPAEQAESRSNAVLATRLAQSVMVNVPKTANWGSLGQISTPPSMAREAAGAVGQSAKLFALTNPITVLPTLAVAGVIGGVSKLFSPVDPGPVVLGTDGLTFGRAVNSSDPKIQKLAAEYLQEQLPNSGLDKLLTARGTYQDATKRLKELSKEQTGLEKQLKSQAGFFVVGTSELPVLPGAASDDNPVMSRVRQYGSIPGVKAGEALSAAQKDADRESKNLRAAESMGLKDKMSDRAQKASFQATIIREFGKERQTNPGLDMDSFLKSRKLTSDQVGLAREVITARQASKGVTDEEYAAVVEAAGK